MPIGNMLRDRQEQYVAQKDTAGTWRILDTWHKDLTKLNPEDEVDDSSEAVTIISEGGFLALVREATRLGVLQNAAMMENEALADQVVELKEENDKLRIQNENTPATIHEDKAGLKQHAIDTIAKIVAIDSVEVIKE
tara:strand:+ start:8174 stop:8584 length:411 start_codon:yes stop_codon:yes gene_type:complete